MTVDGTLTGIITPGQSNDNEKVRHTPEISRAGSWSSDAVECFNQNIPFSCVLLLYRGYTAYSKLCQHGDFLIMRQFNFSDFHFVNYLTECLCFINLTDKN